MNRTVDVALTAAAPAIWGSTYFVTTEFLPADLPLTLAALRALPAGLLLLAVTRTLPPRAWLGRVFILGALNFAIFWTLLFVAAYRLPGGVAATLGSTQAIMVILLARGALGTPIRLAAMLTASAGVCGVAILVTGPDAPLDPVGVLAGVGGAASMAAGTVFSRKWQPAVPPLTFTAWQLTAGGLLLLPVAAIAEPSLPAPEIRHVAGMAYLSLIGAATTYFLWFRGLAKLEPAAVSMLGMMSPVSAVLLGWLLLDQALAPLQILGMAIVIGSVCYGQLPKTRSKPPGALRRPAGGTAARAGIV